ncbi:MAG: efflux RND transporter permease subunit [Pseudomonadota bacterium]
METTTFRQPRLVFLILMVLIASGLASLLSIGRQEDPTITNLFASVTTPFPGASPGRVETLVSAEIEEVLKEIPEVDTVTSVSSTGISIIQIELVETLEAERIEQVWSEIRDALDEARAEFPAGALEPDLNAEGITAYSFTTALSANHDGVPMTTMGRYADALADELRRIPGTKAVDTFGAPIEEVLVTLDAEKTAALGLTPDMVSAAIQAADAKVQAGRLRATQNDLVLEVTGEIKALDRIKSIIVREGQNGAVASLGDIATVERGPRMPLAEMVLQDGKPAILISTVLQEGLQVDVWAGFVRETVEAFQEGVPAGMTLEVVFDQSEYTNDRLLEVGTNMAIGVSLVVGVLLVTLGVRAALIVALILPVVTLATLATMNFIGLAIHQMSVTGLIVALGLLVDAGIVMTDEVAQRIRKGMARIVAVRDSVRRLAAPLFASTVTTALSFTPMILLPGPAGDFVGSIAIAVVIMLAWSFIIAITVTPAIAGWFMPAQGSTNFFNAGVPGGFIARSFQWSLKLAVNNPLRAIAFALILPVVGFLSMPTLTAQFFPGVDRDQFYIEIDMPAGTAITQTRQVVDRLDAKLRTEEGIERISWTIGKSGPAFYYNITGGRDDAPGYAQALITTTSPAATEELVSRFERSLADQAPEAQVLVRGLVQGPPVAAPVELRVVGPDIETLRQIGDDLMVVLSSVDSIVLARTTSGAGAPKIVVDVDEQLARSMGMDLSSVARQLQAGLEGVTGGSMLEGTEQLPVRVRLGDDIRGNLSAIRDLPILSPQATQLAATGGFAATPLSAIANVQLTPSDASITRRNGERVNTVQGFTLREVLPEEALKVVQERLAESNYTLPAGYRLELGGDSDARANTLGNLLASVGMIVTLTIATIVMTFNSFRLSIVALVVCVLSAGLSIFALAVFQYPFGINAIIGVIGSIGVSINAAIIIMTGLRDNEEARNGDRDAMVGVVMGSSRHIVSTTITTFGGFLPLILAGGGFWPPFAMAVAGGVLLSTIISFYFTPPMFALVYAKRPSRQSTVQNEPVTQDNIPMTEPMAIAAE